MDTQAILSSPVRVANLVITEKEALKIYQPGQETTVFFILEQSRRLKQLAEEITHLKTENPRGNTLLILYRHPAVFFYSFIRLSTRLGNFWPVVFS